MSTMTDDGYYTISEVAKILRVSERTVYRWIRVGDMKAKQMKRGGGIRIPKTEIEDTLVDILPSSDKKAKAE